MEVFTEHINRVDGYEANVLQDKMLYFAAKYGRRKIIDMLIYGGAPFDKIACAAVEGDHSSIVFDMVERGVKDILSIAVEAARCGNEFILDDMVSKIEFDKNAQERIATGAAKGGQIVFLKNMIELGADNWNDMVEGAAEGSNLDILLFIIESNKDGDISWDGIARGAVRGNRRDILKLVYDKICNYKEVVMEAYRNGNFDIIRDMYK